MKFPLINIKHIPFSRYGCYVGITEEENRLIVYNARLRFEKCPTFEIIFLKNGNTINFTTTTTPVSCDIASEYGTAKIYMKDDNSFVICSEGIDVSINQISPGLCYGTEYSENTFRSISVEQNTYTLFHLFKGTAILSTLEEGSIERRKLTVGCVEQEIVILVKMDKTEPQIFTDEIDINKDLQDIQEEWIKFFTMITEHYLAEDNYTKITWYNLWSSFARARDVYHYDTMLMSKKFMSSVWSWDHCFNALAVCKMDPTMALQQFLAPFVLQDKNGALPDMWNPDYDIVFGVTKPPIHGWCFSKLMDNYSYSNDILEKVYDYLERWTNWWFNYRDSDHDGIPDYPQGCDCGWDNSTIFDNGYYVEAPDLCAFLVLQMKCLAKIAGKIGKDDSVWNKKADELLKKLYDHSWCEGRFVAKASGSHRFDPNPTGMLVLMPIILGEHLDKEKLERLVEILQNDFLTEHGVATESYKSSLYIDDGYWRGPIWAPTTYLIVEGLRNGGYTQLAERIGKSFCNMARNRAHGNYENFDALTGVGLKAPGYTWTASVYTLLVDEYGENKD